MCGKRSSVGKGTRPPRETPVIAKASPSFQIGSVA